MEGVIVTSRQKMIHHDAMYEPTGVKRGQGYLNHLTAAIAKDAVHAIDLYTFLCLSL